MESSKSLPQGKVSWLHSTKTLKTILQLTVFLLEAKDVKLNYFSHHIIHVADYVLIVRGSSTSGLSIWPGLF